MASRNADSLAGQGAFGASKPRDEPMTRHGHAVGAEQGNAAAPTFSAQTLPIGSAPKDRTFEPNTQNETPGQANNPDVLPDESEGREGTYVKASDTIGGATSGDVHRSQGGVPTGEQNISDRDNKKNLAPGGV